MFVHWYIRKNTGQDRICHKTSVGAGTDGTNHGWSALPISSGGRRLGATRQTYRSFLPNTFQGEFPVNRTAPIPFRSPRHLLPKMGLGHFLLDPRPESSKASFIRAMRVIDEAGSQVNGSEFDVLVSQSWL